MSDLAQIATYLHRIVELETALALMERRHLQFVCMIVHSIGGELRLTKEDFVAVPPGATLHHSVDAMTGDLCYKVTVPDPLTVEDL